MIEASARAGLRAAAVFVLAAPAAEAATSIRTTASTPRAEVGQGVRIEFSVLTDGEDDPKSARLALPPGFSVQGPNISSSRQISFTNGTFENRHGITATWLVAGTRPGRFQIGPATVNVGSALLQGETLDLEVVPKGTLPAPPPRRRGFFDPSDPMDPFSLFKRPPGMPDLDDVPLLDTLPEPPAELALSQAPDGTAFLRATLEPARSVVGEQVTLRVYAYGARGSFDEVGSSEPSRPDFLSYPIVESSYRQRRYTVPIGDRPWQAVKIREVALFSLRAGSLQVGSMKMSFRGRGYPDGPPPGGLARESSALAAEVSEPPLANRPPGYELGTVGAYSLAAEVEPRSVEAGAAVSVTIRVEGTGNVPRRVKLPEAPGVEWMEPSFSEAVVPNAGIIGGWRQLRYVVRIDRPGRLDLGDVVLPYFDAGSGRYETARARLGEVEVTTPAVLPGGAPPPPPAPVERDPFEDLAPPRQVLGALPPRASAWTELPLYWLSVLGAPFFVVLSYAAARLGERLAARLGARKKRADVLSESALADAMAAARVGERARLAASLERALYLVIEDRLGLKARAILRPALTLELTRRGVNSDTALDTTRVLDECDALRFTETDTSLEGLVEQARRVVQGLLSMSRRSADGTEEA